MKIVFTGGGSGGHFYPIIAVAEEIHEIVREEHLLEPQMFYLAPDPYDKRALFENSIEYRHIPSGKLRRYFSLLNIVDFFRLVWGSIRGFFAVFSLYPDAVFSKGGYAALPTLLAARILHIPVIIHESDTVPGWVSRWSSTFADRIAISFPEAHAHFPKTVREHIALTGNPIRRELVKVSESGAAEYLHLDETIPVVLVLGGSQGAAVINDAVVDALPRLVEKYQIIHQTGTAHLEEVERIARVNLEDNPNAHRYKPFGFLNTLAMRMAAGIADIVVTRPGSTLFEIAVWGIPAIVVPITKSAQDHQHTNAFAYARTGAAVVIEEENLTDDILAAQIEEIVGNNSRYEEMSGAAKGRARTDAAHKIAREIIRIGLEHEK